MKTLPAWLLSTTGALAISAEEIAKYITMKSDYTPTEDSVELLHRFKITKDIHTTPWAQWNQSWKSWHHIREKKVTRRMIAPGLLIETNKAEKPEQAREAEITWFTKDGWRRSTAFNIDGKWVIAFDWKGDEIRPGWINWQMVASVDG
jgi:hypothetical protein